MSSTIAIVIFFSLILVGLAIDAKRSKDVTRAVWLPLFWMIICASRSVGDWLNISNHNTILSEADYIEANLAGSPVDKVVLTIAILSGIIIINKRRETLNILKNNKALIAFIIYLGFSCLWSDISAVSFRRWVRLTGNFVMAAVLVTEPEPIESIKSLFRRAAYLLIPLSVMFIKFFPPIGVLYTLMGELIWTGVAVMKNSLAHLSLVMSFFLIWDLASTWRQKVEMNMSRVSFDMLILAMSLWLLKGPGGSTGSSGATSSAALIVGIAILIGSGLPIMKKNFRNLGAIAVLVASLAIVIESSFGIIEFIVTSLGRNMTFTDRVPLWNTLVELGLRSAFFGYGYGGFWIGERVAYIAQKVNIFNQAHNGYLEIFIEGGLAAIILLGVLLKAVFNKIQRSGLRDYEYAVFRLSFFIMILIANFTESAFARERDLLTFVFFIIALDYPLSRNNAVTGAKFNI